MASKKKSPKTEKVAKKSNPEEGPKAGAPAKIPKGGLNTVNLPLASIKVKKGFNPRSELGDLSELKRNIRLHNLISPITVCPTAPGADTYYVIAGARRFAAVSELNKSTIAAVVRDVAIDSPEAFQIAISENSDEARTPLDPEDQTVAFQKLLDGFGGEGHEEEVAKVSGVKVKTVQRVLRYALVPEAVKVKVRNDQFGRRVALAVLDVPEEIRDKVAARMSAGATENDVRIMANEEKAKLRKEGKEVDSGKETTRKGSVSRHNVPFGANPGVAAVERGQRPQAEMRRRLTALILNLEADVEEKVEGAADKLLAAKAALAALYWVTGITSELVEKTSETAAEVAVDAKDFEEALERGKQVVIDTAAAAKAEAEADKQAKDAKAKAKKVKTAKVEKKAVKAKTGKVVKKEAKAEKAKTGKVKKAAAAESDEDDGED